MKKILFLLLIPFTCFAQHGGPYPPPSGGSVTYAAIAGTSSNTVFASQDETNLDNTLWMYEKASRLGDFLNYGRFSWTNAISKLQAGGRNGPITINLIGTGLMEYFVETFITNLYVPGLIPFAGGGSEYNAPYFYNYYPGNGTYVQYVNSVTDPYWYGAYPAITNNTGIATILTSYPFNLIEIDYITAPDGCSSFYILTNSASGYNIASTSINGVSSTTNGASVWLTNSTGFWTGGYAISNNAAGTNRIVNFWAKNTTISNGWYLNQNYQNAGDSVGAIFTFQTNIVGPIFANNNPDLNVYQDIVSLYYLTNGGNFTKLVSLLRTFTPNAGNVFLGTYPATSGSDSSEQVPNLYMLSVVQTSAACAYFDSYTPFESTNVMNNRGFWTYTDQVHALGAMGIWSYWVLRWLDFSDYCGR
jgi:hypothetical protein